MIDVMLAMWRDQRRQSAESGGSPSRKWVYLPGIHQRTRDVATCRYFGLIERSPDGEAGWWRVTRHGHDFLNGTAEIAEWVEVFDNQVVGFGPQMIGVNDVAHGFSLRAELEGHDDGKDERRDERDSEGRS